MIELQIADNQIHDFFNLLPAFLKQGYGLFVQNKCGGGKEYLEKLSKIYKEVEQYVLELEQGLAYTE